eukprot:14800860-Alexandrium_andersonii.AAC.1
MGSHRKPRHRVYEESPIGEKELLQHTAAGSEPPLRREGVRDDAVELVALEEVGEVVVAMQPASRTLVEEGLVHAA